MNKEIMKESSFNIKVKKAIEKLKTIKNIEIIVGVVIICIVVLIYSTVTTNKKSEADNGVLKSTSAERGITAELEGRLAKILSDIEGAGNVSVMITFVSTPEIITASTTNRHSSSQGGNSLGGSTTTETISPIVITNNGKSELIVLKEVMPEVRGVIVVAEGASSIRVRLELMRAVQAVLNIDANAIEIFAMK